MRRDAGQEIANASKHAATVPRLIVADAALDLVNRWKSELAVLQRRSPTSDVVQTLGDCIRELVDAIASGHGMTVQLTISEANTVSHIPISTLRWLCNHRSESVGARKREGTWYLDRARFEEYLASSEGREAMPRSHSAEAVVLPVSDGEAAISELKADARLKVL